MFFIFLKNKGRTKQPSKQPFLKFSFFPIYVSNIALHDFLFFCEFYRAVERKECFSFSGRI